MMLCDIHSVWENLEFIHTYIHLGVVRVLGWDGEGGGYERERERGVTANHLIWVFLTAHLCSLQADFEANGKCWMMFAFWLFL